MDGFFNWAEDTMRRISGKGALAEAIRYAVKRREALTRFCDDARLEADNNRAENCLRPVTLGRKNYLFAGSDKGGERASAIYTLIQTARLNFVDPEAWLRDVLTRIAEGAPGQPHRRTRALALLGAQRRSNTAMIDGRLPVRRQVHCRLQGEVARPNGEPAWWAIAPVHQVPLRLSVRGREREKPDAADRSDRHFRQSAKKARIVRPERCEAYRRLAPIHLLPSSFRIGSRSDPRSANSIRYLARLRPPGCRVSHRVWRQADLPVSTKRADP